MANVTRRATASAPQLFGNIVVGGGVPDLSLVRCRRGCYSQGYGALLWPWRQEAAPTCSGARGLQIGQPRRRNGQVPLVCGLCRQVVYGVSYGVPQASVL